MMNLSTAGHLLSPLMWLGARSVNPAKTMRTLALGLFVATAAWGQIDRGTIQGTVRDATALAIPDASVQVVNIDTNSALDLETNMEGLYTAPNLPAGNYRLVFRKQGFGSVTREPI